LAKSLHHGITLEIIGRVSGIFFVNEHGKYSKGQGGFYSAMDALKLFTDGSADPKLNIGYGAYLVVSESAHSSDYLGASVKVKRFEQTSSTKLELQTLLWALGEVCPLGCRVVVYTDSQNIIGLQGRRDRLEQNEYRSKKNKRIRNYELYQEFYRMVDLMDCEFIKVRGHKVSSQKNEIDRLFTLVDRASRNALRKENL